VRIDVNYTSKKETEKLLGRFKRDLEKIRDIYSSLKQRVHSGIASFEEQLKGIVRDIQRADSDLSKIASIPVNETEINELERMKKDAEANLKSNSIITVVVCVSTMVFSLLVHPVAMLLSLPVLLFIYRAFSAYKRINDVKSDMETKRQEIHDIKFKKRRTEEIEVELESSKNEKRNLEKALGEKSKLYDILDSQRFTTFQEVSKSLDSLDVRKYPALKELKELLSNVATKYPNLMLADEPIDVFEEKLKREIEELNEKLMNKRAIIDKIEVLKESIQSKGKLEDRKSKLFEEIKEIEDKIIELKKKLPSIDYSDENLKQAEIRKDELDEAIRRIEGDIKDFRGQLKSIEPDLKKRPKFKEELLELQKSIEELAQKVRIYRELESVFKETSGNIRKRLGPQIEAYFSWILPKITNNRYKKVRIDSDFNIQAFSEEKHDYVDLGMLSGGTSDQLLISLRLAFAKSLTPASGQYSTQFLFLDEPLSSFDPNRRSSFLEFLRSLETSSTLIGNKFSADFCDFTSIGLRELHG
jgi:exonuclease SbcC